MGEASLGRHRGIEASSLSSLLTVTMDIIIIIIVIIVIIKSIIIWEGSGNIWMHLGGIWRHLETSGTHLGNIWIWDASGSIIWKHLGGIWRHLGGIWEPSGRPGLPRCPQGGLRGLRFQKVVPLSTKINMFMNKY